MVESIVEVGGWEHMCCGRAIERNQTVELTCLLYPDPVTGQIRLVETHHELDDDDHPVVREVVDGWVTGIDAVDADGSHHPVDRLPSGRSLRGFDNDDDGHLEDPWTHTLVVHDTEDFLVTIATRTTRKTMAEQGEG